MRCIYCGKVIATRGTASASADSRNCGRCSRLKQLRFVVKQGDGVSGFREIMLSQHPNEPGRKLIETRSWHFTIFVSQEEEICGFELADAYDSHVLKWKHGERAIAYRVENLGKGYGNHDVLHPVREFAVGDVLTELMAAGRNIVPEVRQVLLEGIAAYAKPE